MATTVRIVYYLLIALLPLRSVQLLQKLVLLLLDRPSLGGRQGGGLISDISGWPWVAYL
jgi:hypothetical protein